MIFIAVFHDGTVLRNINTVNMTKMHDANYVVTQSGSSCFIYKDRFGFPHGEEITQEVAEERAKLFVEFGKASTDEARKEVAQKLSKRLR